MNYQKYYSNQIHSSSLLCQLAQLWKTQTLCDAVIKTGNINTKAHRLVLVAACPMLQSMDNAAIGSHLEVRLASEIKQESVNTFLQYLYEGFFLLTEDNCRDIEKIARLLQVDSVIKCCADFFKNLQEKTGLPVYNSGQYKYTTYDMLEFRHMRVSGMQKSMHETANKRASEFQPHSPSNKRQRTHRPGSPSNDSHYSSDGHRSSQSSELWDRVPRLGLGMSSHGATGRKVQPGVIEIMEDSLELVNTEPVEKDSYGRPIDSRPPVQKSVSISVASKVTGGDPELQIIDVGSQGRPSQTATSSSRPHPRISTDNQNNMYLSTSSPSSRSDIPSGSSTQNTADATNLPSPRTEHQRQSAAERQSNSQFSGLDLDFTKPKPVVPVEMHASPMVNTGNRISSSSSSYSPSVQSQPKPFAAGSASQGSMSTPSNIPSSSPSNLPSSQSESTPMPELSLFGMNASQSGKSSRPQPGPSSRSDSLERSMSAERPKVESGTPGSNTPEGMAPDISIVKIESTVKDGETGGLDMFVDAPDDGGTHHPQGMDEMGEQYEGSDYDVEEPPGELEGSNEGSNLSGDQNNSWYMNTMKGDEFYSRLQKRDPWSGPDGHEHRFVTSALTAYIYGGRPKQKPGPKPRSVRLKFYLLPDGCEVPKTTKQDPVIETHQSLGYGYPADYYEDSRGKAVPISLYLSPSEFKEKIRSLYPLLKDRDFNLYRLDSKKSMTEVPFVVDYFRQMKYQGNVVIKIKKENPSEVLKQENVELEIISD